jgi:hypothetical protein
MSNPLGGGFGGGFGGAGGAGGGGLAGLGGAGGSGITGGGGGGSDSGGQLPTLSGQSGSIQLPVVSFTYGLTSMMEEAQLHQGVQYYPIKVVQDDFTFTVQFQSEQAYRQAQDFIERSTKQLTTQQFTGTQVTSGYLHFSWPELNIDYQGFIKQSPMGAKKWDYAPKATYTMILIQDSIYTPTYNASDVPAFNSIYGQDTLNVPDAVGRAEPRLNPPPPQAPPPGP